MSSQFLNILERAEHEAIGRDEALVLFKESEDNLKAQDLFRTAVRVREKELGTTFQWSGGIATILPCELKPLCCYCPYWIHDRQPLSIDEILKGVEYIEEQGITNFHLSGGTTLGSEGWEVVEIVKKIRTISNLKITVNVGAALSKAAILELQKLGVIRIGASFETINEDLFKRLKPGDSMEAKKELAATINEEGLELGSGLLAGLSTEPSRYQDYIDFMFYMKQFDHLKRVYVSRFNPVRGTPMENHPRCSTMEGARIIAIMRLVLRGIEIGPAAGWSYDDIPIWVMAGGGNVVGGVHVSRAPGYRNNWYLHSALDYREGMEFRNTIAVAEPILRQSGVRRMIY